MTQFQCGHKFGSNPNLISFRATSDGFENQRVIFNTHASLLTCVLVTAAITSLVDDQGKFDPVHIQNSVLAGYFLYKIHSRVHVSMNK